jgi:hypothetical protein
MEQIFKCHRIDEHVLTSVYGGRGMRIGWCVHVGTFKSAKLLSANEVSHVISLAYDIVSC